MKASSLKAIWSVLKESLIRFSEDKVPKLGASLAYFTLFSVGPLMLVVIFIAGLVLGRQAIEGSLQNQFQSVMGESAASQLQQIITSAAKSSGGIIAGMIGIVTLLIASTSVFGEIQDSMNAIWHVKLKPKQGWQLMLKNRLLSFGIVASMGFLLLVSLVAAAMIESLGKGFQKIVPHVSTVLFYVISQSFTLLVAAILFAIIFKTLPAATMRWRDVLPGAVATALLFMAGRFAISFYIARSNFDSTYGVAGALVVLMVWVYYSSLIFYFGAEITRTYTAKFGSGIQPKGYAMSTA